MITVYTNKGYLKFYNLFKEFNLFELAEAYYTCNWSDIDKRCEAEIKLLTAWIGMYKKHAKELISRDDCQIYYNLSKENLSLYKWMNSCLNGMTSSYCHTYSNFQVHFMKYNKTFIVSTPDGMSQVAIQNILDKHVYEEYLDYNMFVESQQKDCKVDWREHRVHAAISALGCNSYCIHDIIFCIKCVKQVWDCYLKDQTEDTIEDGQEEDDE